MKKQHLELVPEDPRPMTLPEELCMAPLEAAVPDEGLVEALLQAQHEEAAYVAAMDESPAISEALTELMGVSPEDTALQELSKQVEFLQLEGAALAEENTRLTVLSGDLNTQVERLKAELAEALRKLNIHHDTLPRNAYKACPFCKDTLLFTPPQPTIRPHRPWKGDRR